MSGGGGKGGTTTQTVTIPQEVMDRYRNVNNLAEQVASRPFQAYSYDPNAFVAELSSTQQAGINRVNQNAGAAQPYFQQAGQMTLDSAGPVNAEQWSPEAIQRYMSPYIQNVADTTMAQLGNVNQQQMEGLKGDAIRAGAFGGDRSGIARANLANQQNLATGKTLADIYSSGFNQASGQFNQQQGVNLQAGQANRAAGLGAAAQYASLGAGQQNAALQGAQAQMSAGQIQQQVEQAKLDALRNQFYQQQAYPFQVAQFLANIAEGTGAQSGSTTTTQQPTPFFSDERLKENVEPIGKSFDGQNIYRFNYKGDPSKQIGLIAQEVEGRNPDAVGHSQGYRTVDYDAATAPAAEMGKMASGYYAGGLVLPTEARSGYADGGMPDFSSLARNQAEMYRGLVPGAQNNGGLPGGSSGRVPAPISFSGRSIQAATPPREQPSGLASAAETGKNIAGLIQTGSGLFDKASNVIQGAFGSKNEEPVSGGLIGENQFAADDMSGRAAFADGGAPQGLYGQGNLLDIPTEDNQPRKMLEPAKAPGQSGGSGLGGLAKDLGSAASLATSIGTLGSTASSVGSTLMAALPFFSDERLKENVEPIGKSFDGQNIYRYNYKGDPSKQIGLIAQEVERRNPNAVGSSHGYKTVDYGAATDSSADIIRHSKAEGGSLGDLVGEELGASGLVPAGLADTFNRMLQKESGGQHFEKDGRVKTSPKGAIGIAQVMPGTAPEAAKLAGVEYDENRYRNDPGYNNLLGNAYFRNNVKIFGGDEEKAAAAYNAGPQRVKDAMAKAEATGTDWRDHLPAETKGYISGITGKSSAGQPERPANNGLLPGLGAPATAMREQPEGTFARIGEKLGLSKENRSENFWVPALTGIGTMLASRSPFLASAVGEGLVGGASAYEKMRQGTADLNTKQAGTANTYQGMARNAIFEVGGRPFITVYKNGKPTPMSLAEAVSIGFDKLEMDPGTRAIAEEYAKSNGAAGTATPAPTPATAATVAPTGTQKVETKPLEPVKTEPGATPAAPKVESAPATAEIKQFDLSPQEIEAQRNEAKTIYGMSTDAKRGIKDVFTPQQEVAVEANKQRVELAKAAQLLADAPKTGVLSQGAFQPAMKEAVAKINSLLSTLGAAPVMTNELGEAQNLDKIVASLKGKATTDAGQRAYQALETYAQMFPSGKLSPEGAAKTISGLLIQNQKEIDKDRYFQNLRKAAEGEKGEFASEAMLTGRGADKSFNDKYGSAYEKDRKSIEDMFNRNMVTQDGHKMSLYSYISKYGTNIPDKIKAQIAEKYGSSVFKYFPSINP